MKNTLLIPAILSLAFLTFTAAVPVFAVSPDEESEETETISDTGEEDDRSGWQKLDTDWYFYNENGGKVSGWLEYNDNLYFLDPDTCIMQSGWLKQNEAVFYLGDNGIMKTGWVQLDDTWYLFGADGKMSAGWTEYDDHWYYFDPDTGAMQTGWFELNDNTYYFDESGHMQTGWVQIDDTWYYFSVSGTLASDWINYNDNWYYLDPDSGAMQTGWLELSAGSGNTDTAWYYLQSTGAMATGWCRLGDYWYYLEDSGVMASGWITSDDNRYYLYMKNDSNGGPYGSMAHDTMIDGQTILSDGHAATDIQDRMYDTVRDTESSTSYIIAVDTDTCYVGIFTGEQGSWTLKYFWPCSPGAYSNPTITGTFTVNLKGYAFDSYGSRCYYYTQFCGNYLFHSVLYNQYGQLTDGRLGQHLSHGCVRLAIENAKWIYNNIPQGTTVIVYD